VKRPLPRGVGFVTSRITLTHGSSPSNLPLFVAEGASLFEAEGVEVEVPAFRTLSSSADLVDSGLSELGTVTFTEPLIDASEANPIVPVGGSGLMGVTVMARHDITSIGELKGPKVSVLEALLHDALAAYGLAFADVELIYLDDVEDVLGNFESRRLDAITLARTPRLEGPPPWGQWS